MPLVSRCPRGALLLFAAAVSAPLPGAARADDPAAVAAALEQHLVSIVERVEGSVVSVVRGRTGGGFSAGPLGPFGVPPGRGLLPPGEAVGPDDADFAPEQFGAGVVVADAAGARFILTNHHVVRGGPVADAPTGETATDGVRLFVRFRDRRGYYATIHAADPRSDLAVLRIDYAQLGVDPPADREAFPKPLPLSAADDYRKGQLVLVFGNPYATARDGSAAVGWGIVGNVLRRPAPAGPAWERATQAAETIHHYGTLLQLDARMDVGFSGGAAVNKDGELIGLTTSLAAIEGYESTAGFAIPIDAGTRRLIDALLGGHEAEYGLLGVSPGEIGASQLRLFGPTLAGRDGAARADGVKRDSPAGRAGVRTGDLILALDGRPIRGVSDLMRLVGLAGPGETVTLEIFRPQAGGTRPVRVTLGKWPVVNEAETIATVPRFEPWRGVVVDHATARQRFLTAQLDPYPRGVVVLSADGPLGGERGLRPGDFVTQVNGRPVETPREFDAAVHAAGRTTLTLSDGRTIDAP